MERILNKVFMYVWLICALTAVVMAFCGACHQLFTALLCAGMYIVARCDWKKAKKEASDTESKVCEAILKSINQSNSQQRDA